MNCLVFNGKRKKNGWSGIAPAVSKVRLPDPKAQ
jgi:hypothetical protein